MSEFRMIKGYEGKYWIDSVGHIKNKRGKILTPIDLGGGIKAIDLYGQGLRDRKLIRVLLLETFPELFDRADWIDDATIVNIFGGKDYEK